MEFVGFEIDCFGRLSWIFNLSSTCYYIFFVSSFRILFCYQVRLDCTKRPDLVHVWLKNGRKYNTTPKIEDVTAFSQLWWSWWKSLQPKWRITTDGVLSRHLPVEGEKWILTYKGGCIYHSPGDPCGVPMESTCSPWSPCGLHL
jgi:hypothetical protein